MSFTWNYSLDERWGDIKTSGTIRVYSLCGIYKDQQVATVHSFWGISQRQFPVESNSAFGNAVSTTLVCQIGQIVNKHSSGLTSDALLLSFVSLSLCTFNHQITCNNSPPNNLKKKNKKKSNTVQGITQKRNRRWHNTGRIIRANIWQKSDRSFGQSGFVPKVCQRSLPNCPSTPQKHTTPFIKKKKKKVCDIAAIWHWG